MSKVGKTTTLTEHYEIVRDNVGQHTANFDRKIGRWLPYLKKPVSVLRKASDLTATCYKNSPNVFTSFQK